MDESSGACRLPVGAQSNGESSIGAQSSGESSSGCSSGDPWRILESIECLPALSEDPWSMLESIDCLPSLSDDDTFSCESDDSWDSEWDSDYDSDSDCDIGVGDPAAMVAKRAEMDTAVFGAPCPPLTRKRKRGRPAYCDIYPLAAIVEQVLSNRPGGADRGRSQTTNFTTLTLKELTKHVCDNLRRYCLDFGLPEPKRYPGMKTIRRLGKAPNPRFRAAKYYRNDVPFRTAPKKMI